MRHLGILIVLLVCTKKQALSLLGKKNRKVNDQPVDLPAVINRFLGRAMRKRRPPPAYDHAGACDASLGVRPLGFSIKQAIMSVPVSLPDTRTRARNTLQQSLFSHLLVWILFFLFLKNL